MFYLKNMRLAKDETLTRHKYSWLHPGARCHWAACCPPPQSAGCCCWSWRSPWSPPQTAGDRSRGTSLTCRLWTESNGENEAQKDIVMIKGNNIGKSFWPEHKLRQGGCFKLVCDEILFNRWPRTVRLSLNPLQGGPMNKLNQQESAGFEKYGAFRSGKPRGRPMSSSRRLLADMMMTL